jgi:hypothetical protein
MYFRRFKQTFHDCVETCMCACVHVSIWVHICAASSGHTLVLVMSDASPPADFNCSGKELLVVVALLGHGIEAHKAKGFDNAYFLAGLGIKRYPNHWLLADAAHYACSHMTCHMHVFAPRKEREDKLLRRRTKRTSNR